MRSVVSLAILAGLAVATPTPLTPSSRQTAYDIPTNDPSGPLDLSDIGVLSGGSGLLGANSDIAGLHLRHVKRGLLDGLSTSDVGGTLGGLTKGGALSDLGLGGLGIKRDHEKNKRLLNFGRPSGGFTPKGNTCPTGRRYCCKHVRKYSDSRNAGLLDGALVQDGLLNDVLVGLTCDLIAGSLAPDSCDKHSVCCASQRSSNQGLLNLGCTPFGLDIGI